MAAWSRTALEKNEKCHFCIFLENDPLRANFQNSVLRWFIGTPIDVLCSNVMKFGRRKIGKIVRYLPNQKNKNSPGSPALATARIASYQNLPRPAPENVLRVLQTSSKSVHFRRYRELESQANFYFFWSGKQRTILPIFGRPNFTKFELNTRTCEHHQNGP